MGKYFVKFSYLGTQYRGIQKNVVKDTTVMVRDVDTIQGALENALTTIMPKCSFQPRLHTSSRTDVGVHAFCNTGHVVLNNKYNAIYNPDAVLRHVNRYMMKCNHDIRLLEFVPMKPNFHARALVKSRTYIYRFMIPKNKDDHQIPIMDKLYSYCLRADNVDLEKLKNGTKLFLGKKNFETFSAKKIHHKPINYVRSLNALTLEKSQSYMPNDRLSQNYEYWNIVCSARSFLYKQVRRIVGSLFALATGKITEKDITVMLQVPGHHNWPARLQLAGGHGLYLANVEYCQEELDTYKIQYKTCPDPNIVIPIEEDEINYAEI